jgi:hypothetical protein
MKNMKTFEDFDKIDESKKDDHKRKFGCVMGAVEGDDWFSLIQGRIEPEDIYDPDGTYGIETEPHVTVLFGLCDEILVPADVVRAMEEFKAPVITVKRIDSFSNKDFDVLKLSVESKDLRRMNDRLRQFPHVDTFPTYEPHITLAYLKKGTAGKYTGDLEAAVAAQPLTAFKYGMKDGSEIHFTLEKEKEE